MLLAGLACDFDDDEIVSIICTIVLARAAIRDRFYLTSSCLTGYQSSSAQQLLKLGNDSDYIATMSVCRKTFSLMLVFFSQALQLEDSFGRPRIMDTKGHLALILTFLSSSAKASYFCLIFGLPPATISRCLSHSRQALYQALAVMPPAHITWPNQDDMKRYSDLVSLKYPLIRNKFGFVDGTNVPIQAPANNMQLQNAYYNSYLADCYCSQVRCWSKTFAYVNLDVGNLFWTHRNDIVG